MNRPSRKITRWITKPTRSTRVTYKDHPGEHPKLPRAIVPESLPTFAGVACHSVPP